MANSCGCKKPDRYISFEGIDCDGKAQQLMDLLDQQLTRPGRANVFWEYFAAKRAGTSGGLKPDNLLLIHANINVIREFFETWQDEAALTLLMELEEECC